VARLLRPTRWVLAPVALILVAALMWPGCGGAKRPTGTTQRPTGTPSPPRVVGCTPRRPRFREHGPRLRRVVALTFDGGPSSHTPRVLSILRRHGVRATFFLRGDAIPGRTALLRRQLAEGHELANHSYSHPHLPSYRQLARTTRLIRTATGFSPCLFRAPYGDWDGRLVADAWRLGMATIQWDVDTLDSLGAEPDTVRARASSLPGPGSIILMHDGEGASRASLGMLPGILAALRRRGLRSVTVSQLLGFQPRLEPSAR
jgi:peptidoglycan/xylan/chitin deacetylase (PgdA/CDA1 family)